MLILFNSKEEVTGFLGNNDIASAIQTEGINDIVTLDVVIRYSANDKMKNAFYIGHKDVVNENAIQVYKISRVFPENEGFNYTCIHCVHDDLKNYGYIKEERLKNVNATTALTVALNGCRWEIGNVENSNLADIDFYYISRQEALSKIIEIYNVEFGYRLVFSNNKIIKRYIDIYNKRGVKTYKRYAYGHKALQVIKEENQGDLYTAAVGRGKGEEKFNAQGQSTGGYGRRISFKDVEWKKANGDPVDKPKGQEFVEIPEQTALYGYSDNTPRLKIVVYENITDPKTLLQKTYDDLIKNSRPLVQFKATIEENDKLELGDSVYIIRKDLNIYYETRIFRIKRDILNKLNIEIELGDNLEYNKADFNKSINKKIEILNESTNSGINQLQKALADSLSDDISYSYKLDVNNPYNLPSGFYTFNKPINNNPDKAIYIGAGKFAISNKKDSQGNFIWTTFGTGDGFTADVVNSGSINADLIKTGTINANLIKTGTIDVNYIKIKNQDLSEFVRGQLYIDGARIRVGDEFLLNGSGLNVRANSQYIQLNDTGGRGQLLINGTAAVYGYNYYYELNSGGLKLDTNEQTGVRENGGYTDIIGRLSINGVRISLGNDGNLKWGA